MRHISIQGLLFLLMLSLLSSAKTFKNNVNISSIDFNDTINFEMDRAQYLAGKILIPISISSDDTIYALDFELKFNNARLDYDSIYDPSGQVQPFVYLNPVDSVLRLTSFSVNPFKKDTTVFILQFNVLNLPILPGDIYQLYGYLNGDSCSVGIPNVVFTSTASIVQSSLFSAYPNPVCDNLYIRSEEEGFVIISDMDGRQLLTEKIYKETTSISVRGFSPGMYMLKFIDKNQYRIQRIIIQ